MKYLLVGGKGFLGSEFRKLLKKEDVWTLGPGKGKKHIKFDITKGDPKIDEFDIVINLVGLSPLKKPKVSYSEVHVVGVKNLILALKKDALFVQISALGADMNSKNEYLRTKGKAEYLIKKSKTNYLIFRPSVIFDKESEFFKIINKTIYLPFFPNIKTEVMPIYREDVAKFVLDKIKSFKNETFDVCGQEKMTIYEMVKLYRKSKGYFTIKIPSFIFKPFYYLYCKLFQSHNQYSILNQKNIGKKVIKTKKYSSWLKEIN